MEQSMIFLQQVFNGLTLGSVYALVAVGLSLIWSTAQLLDFAYGEVFMLGGLFFWSFMIGLGMPLLPSMLLSVAACALLGWSIQRCVYMRVADKDHVIVLLATIGMSMILKDGATKIWGSDTHIFPVIFTGTWNVGSVVIRTHFLFIIAATAWMIGLFHFVIHRTKLGMALRAVAENRTVAAVMGVNYLAMLASAFAFSYVMGAMAGALIGPIHFVATTGGTTMMIKGIVAAVLGGFGSMPGALAGGLVIGMIEALSAGFISSAFKDVIVFAIFIAVLFVRPGGLMGKRHQGVSEI
jgi:branched-chain amino acid transport system permease protein